MYSLANPIFWIYFVYFSIAASLAFFIPGNLFIRKLKLDLISEILLSIVTGFVLLSLLGILLGFLHLRNLTYLYLAACVFVWITSNNFKALKRIPHINPGLGITMVILLGTLIQLSSVWLNGITLHDGVYFCCGIPDTITHLSLTSEMVQHFPPNEPGFSGIALTNYHYLSNLGVAELVRIFGLPLVNTQYQYMTILFSLLLGLSAIALAQALHLGRRFIFWFTFFLYFSGDIIFLLPTLFGKTINFSVTTLENASSLWISPPRFYALIVLLSGLTLFAYWLKKKDIYTGIVMAIVMGSVIGFKVYVGIFILSGFAILGVTYAVTKKYTTLLPILLLFVLSGLLYILVNKDAGGLVFSGFWRFENFIVQPLLGASRMELARRVFLDHYDFIRAFLYDIFFGFLYIFFSAGTLLLGLLQTKGSLQKIPKGFTTVLIAGLLSTCIAGFFFLQQTGGANTSQFLISIYTVGVLYAALAISWWLYKFPSKVAIVMTITIILFTSTRVLHDTFQRLQRISGLSGVFIQNDTLLAYKYFATTEKDSVVLVYDDSAMDCLFITIFGERPTYTCTVGLPGVISDQVLIVRNDVKHAVFSGKDLKRAREELNANGISYIYIPKNNIKDTNIENLNVQKVYETNDIAIYEVVK